ncbi:GNAT family N-acetyltransferase [Patescibacteria group bacterium]|nr:GNAT family N-acetyltransferase [Patescibacteria group bacterium]
MPETETGVVCMKCGPTGHTTENCPHQQNKSAVEVESILEEEGVDKVFPKEMEKTKENLVSFFTAFYKNQNMFEGDERRIDFYAKRMAEIDPEVENYRFYVVEKDGRKVGTGQLEFLEVDGEKKAMLASLTVEEEERGKKYDGKKISEMLTDVRIEKAKELGYKKVDTTIFSENPDKIRALAIKFNQGYRMYKFESYPIRDDQKEMGAFWLEKNIEGEEDEFGKEEVSLGLEDLKAISNQLESGWVGVRVENNKVFFKQKA